MATLLRLGSQGSAVADLQTKLNAVGWRPLLVVDGSFGPMTLQAVTWFQSSHTDQDGKELQTDGVVGSKTLWALANRGQQDTNLVTPTKPVPPPTLTLPQRAFRMICYYHAAGVVEGPLGSNTGGPQPGQPSCYSVDAIEAPFGLHAEPWCAMGIWNCVTKAGLELPVDGFAAVSSWYDAAYRGLYGMKLFKAGTIELKQGDLFLVGSSIHMGMVEKSNGDGTMTTIEFNSSDRCRSLIRAEEDPVSWIIRLPD